MTRPDTPRSQSLIHMSTKGGHREDYQRVLSETFGLEPSVGRVGASNFLMLVRAKTLLFGTLDDDVRGFVLVAIARMIIGRKTAALFLRPQSCFFPSGLQAKVKYALFHFFAKSRSVSVCTILPFDLEPRYQQVAKYGLADPQLWDRNVMPFAPLEDFARELKAAAGRRKIMAFIGTASPFKGVSQICEMMADPSWDDSVCVIFVGRVPQEVSSLIMKAEGLGAVVIPRFISNDELDGIYEVSDLIWAAYHPGYDQASGNFGRAIQSGKVPVVRAGTLIARLAKHLDYPAVAIDFNNLQDAISNIQSFAAMARAAPEDQIAQWELEFKAAMLASL